MPLKSRKKPAIRFFAELGSHTGYGMASRNFCKVFSESFIDTKFAFSQRTKDKFPAFVNSLNNYSGKTSVDFYLHAPPYDKHSSLNYKVGYFYWEADKLPEIWRSSITKLDEIWAPCELVKKACLRSGFRGPIKIVPTPSDLKKTDLKISIPSPLSMEYVLSEDVFKFYSIFQWHERKGYKELLISYFKEFKNTDNVVLILKVNPLNVLSYTRERIRIDILRIKKKLNLKDYPKVYLIDEIISEDQVCAIHRYSDCYVSAHHGEGWGMPIHDALYMGNHVIAPKYGGVVEFFDSKSCNLIDFDMGPVKNMEWSRLYSSNQSWAYPKIKSIRKNMRNVYENSDSLKYKTKNAQVIASSMTVKSVIKIVEDSYLKLGRR